MKNINLIGISLLLLVIPSLSLFSKVSMAETKIDFSQEQQEIPLDELNDFLESHNNEVRFYHRVEEKLKEKGYEHRMLGMMYAKDEIWITINKEANEQEQIEVKEIFNETAIQYKLDPKIFKFKVSNLKLR